MSDVTVMFGTNMLTVWFPSGLFTVITGAPESFTAITVLKCGTCTIVFPPLVKLKHGVVVVAVNAAVHALIFVLLCKLDSLLNHHISNPPLTFVGNKTVP